MKKKCDSLDTAHLELSRANRKVQEATDPAKKQYYQSEQRKCQDTYDRLKAELDASFQFILNEARAHSPSGEVHPLGLLYQELTAFKQSQKSFYAACYGVSSTFTVDADINVHSIWTDFQDRRLAAIEQSMASLAAHAQSGRDLIRQGLSESSSNLTGQRQGGGRAPPPPPPPPPPAPSALPSKQALYDYTAQGDDELTFTAGSRITIVDQSDPNWWTGRDEYGNTGMVPSNYF